MNKFSTHIRSKSVILFFISILLLISACTPAAPQHPVSAPPQPAQPPVIESITADTNEVPILANAQIVAVASAAAGNTLTYKWSTDGGTITGEGNTATWTAPATSDNYTIRLTVTDSQGGSATGSIAIAAIDEPNRPPIISGFTIDGVPASTQNTSKGWVTKTIHCNVEDPDGDQLTYVWVATCGRVTGESDTVSWTSPGVYGNCTVTVIVNDGRGGQAQGSVVFLVLCCGRG